MSKLGYIHKSYGQEIKIASANTYAYNVLSGSNLPSNTLIIASPIDENNDDTGTYSLLITDYQSNPIRLTYTLQEGSGIVYSEDSIKLNIDNNTIIEKNNELTVNISALIDNNKINYDGNKLYLNVNNFDKASDSKIGVYRIDENTIKNSEDELFIDTSKLNYANEITETAGIFIGDGNLIKIDNGIISLNQNNLHKADNKSFGVVSGDSNTININNGVISVNTQNLNKCYNSSSGIVKADNDTIIYNTNLELTVNSNNLNKTSETNLGVFKIDDKSLEIVDDSLSVKEYNKFGNLINNIKNSINTLDKKINDINYLLNEYKVGIKRPEIYDFYCTGLLTSVLEEPIYLNQSVNDMPFQFITTEFAISTNCPFIISIKYENNIDPAILLYELNYNNIDKYTGNDGLLAIYQTTEEKIVPIKMTFICKNYYTDNTKEFSTKTQVKIIISCANDATVSKSIIYTILRYNSGYNINTEYDDDNMETHKKGT